MPLVTVHNLSIRFRGPALLDDVDCIIEAKQRIGLLGRNGAGKSTLLKILSGQIEPDHGTVAFESGKRIALLTQHVPTDLEGSVREVVRDAFSKQPKWNFGGESSNAQAGIEDGELWSAEEWEIDHRVDQILSRMELDGEADVASMSAGMKRRVLLARCLAGDPDLLLLDEPTNHLDIDSIRWLENFLDRFDGAYMFITHDRQFLRRLAKRILEIESGRLFDWSCDYATFLDRKEAEIAAQEKQEKLFDKKLAEEEAWIRQGIKARRTRNEGRVRALQELRKVRADRRDKVGTSNLQIQEGIRSGNLVCRVDDISFAYRNADDTSRKIIDQFSTTIFRGDKLGIVGPNGVGKTTLLKILLGELEPSTGTVRLGSNLQIAYFDQLRQQLDEDRTVEEDVSDGYQTINQGGNARHVLGYLQDFLFTPERARTKIAYLSGGERNRVLLAKLFAKPANVIVLDEPTNDLDAETMEMLEARLVEYSGTLLMVSHDREFLNNVVTGTLVFEPTHAQDSRDSASYRLAEYVGGYDEWLRQYDQREASQTKEAVSAKNVSSSSSAGNATPSAGEANKRMPDSKKKLSFKETKELETLPEKIETLEASIADFHAKMAEPEYYKQTGGAIAEKQAELESMQQELATAYERWEELESRS